MKPSEACVIAVRGVGLLLVFLAVFLTAVRLAAGWCWVIPMAMLGSPMFLVGLWLFYVALRLRRFFEGSTDSPEQKERFQFSLRTMLLVSLMIALCTDGMATWIEARSHGKLSLHEAADRGDLKEVKWLLDQGADINEENVFSDTPLIYAAGRGHMQIVQYLVSRGADINKGRERGRSALALAICNHHSELAKWLIEQGADVNVKDSEGDSVLHYAARLGTAEIAELLIAKGAAVNAKGAGGRTPLYATVAFRGEFDRSVAEVLLKHGADPNIPTDESLLPGLEFQPREVAGTPLARAVYFHYQEMVELLTKYGAK